MKTFAEQNFRLEQNDKIFSTLRSTVENAQDNLSMMKDQAQSDKKMFVANLKEVNDQLVFEQKGLRDQQHNLDQKMFA